MRWNCGQYNYSRIYKLEITCEVLMGIVESPADGRPRDKITVHAYSIHAGQRAFTYYVQRHEPPLSLYFRNAFNVYELAGKVTTSRALKMTTEKATKYFLPMLCLSCIDVLTSVVLPAPFFTLLMGAFNIFCEWKSVLESTHDKQELREAANTFNVIVKNKDDIAAIVTQAMEMMAKKQELERDRKSRDEGLESSE